MMRLAQMRTRVIIKFMKDNVDAAGGRSTALGTYAERWAAVEVMGGSSSVLAQVLQSASTYKITLRYDPEIKASWFVELPDTGAQLRIDGPPQNPGLANVQTVLMCSSYKDGSGGK